MPFSAGVNSLTASISLSRRRFLTSSLALAACASCPAGLRAQSLADFAQAAQNQGKGLFGSTEIPSLSFEALPQWRRVLAVMEQERPVYQACLADPTHCSSNTQSIWRQIVVQASKLPQPEQLHAVNRFFNRWPYKLDPEIYGRSEYWASPSEFMSSSGDCEDFAIAKFFALRDLGLGNDDMRIVILFDRIRNIGHAVLAVYRDSDALILDSLSNMIVSHSKYRHYLPQYSMNETLRWAHVMS